MGNSPTPKNSMNNNAFANVNAWFTNIDDESFDIVWGGRVRVTLKPGETKLLPGYLAESGGKHLTNRMLLKTGNPKMESYTSPKKPSDVPEFWNRFSKIVRIEGSQAAAAKRDELDTEIELLNAAKPQQKAAEEADEDEFEDDEEVVEEAKEEVKEEVVAEEEVEEVVEEKVEEKPKKKISKKK